MKNMKKMLAMLMTLAMLVSVCAVFAVPASAVTEAVFVVSADNVADGKTAGTYDLATAIGAVKEGGTITMSGNATFSERVDMRSANKTYTIDGSKGDGTNYTWTHTRSGGDAFVVGGNGKTVTLKNINVHTTTRCQIIMAADGHTVNLVLGIGMKFTAAEGDTYSAAPIMMGRNTTLTIDGAEFAVDAPAIVLWNGDKHVINLNKGTLSSGNSNQGAGAIVSNNATSINMIVVNDVANPVLVDNGTDTPYGIKASDITDVPHCAFGYTKAFQVDADNVADGKTAGTYGLLDAVNAVKDNGKIKMVADTVFGGLTTGNTLRLKMDDINKNYTIDGTKANGTYKWMDFVSGGSTVRFGDGTNDTTSETIKLQNIDFVAFSGDQIIELSDVTLDTLVLGQGTTFNAESSVTSWSNGGAVMFGKGTLTIDGVVSNIPGATVSLWGPKDHTLNLKSGTLSAGSTFTAIDDGYGVTSGTHTVNVNGTVQVKDYNIPTAPVHSLYESDINSAIKTLVINKAEGVELIARGVKNGSDHYDTLDAAVAAASDGDTLIIDGIVVPSATVVVDKDLTLRGGAEPGLFGVDYSILTLHNANVTIEDLTLKCASTAQVGVVTMGDTTEGQVAYTGATLTLNSGAKLVNTKNSGTNTGGNGVAVQLGGTTNIVMNAGSVVETGGTAIIGDGTGKAFNFTMNGGTITAANRGLTLASPGINVVINDGSITAKDWVFASYGLAVDVTVNNGTLTATGGSIFANVTSANGKYVINGGTLTSSADTAASSAANGTYVVNGGTIKAKNADLYNATIAQQIADEDVAFSNNYMYLYVNADKTLAGSGLAFATKAAYAGTCGVKYGMLIANTNNLNGEELTLASTADGQVAIVIADSALSANGYIDTAIVNVGAENAVTSTFTARAYAQKTISLGDGATAVVDVNYGATMEGAGNQFADSYAFYNPDYAADEAVKTIVDHYLAMTVAE